MLSEYLCCYHWLQHILHLTIKGRGSTKTEPGESFRCPMGKYQSLDMLKLLLRATPHRKGKAPRSIVAMALCTAAVATSHHCTMQGASALPHHGRRPRKGKGRGCTIRACLSFGGGVSVAQAMQHNNEGLRPGLKKPDKGLTHTLYNRCANKSVQLQQVY